MRGFLSGLVVGLFAASWHFGHLPEPVEKGMEAAARGAGSLMRSWIDSVQTSETPARSCPVPGTLVPIDIFSDTLAEQPLLLSARAYHQVKGVISNNLYTSAMTAGVPDRVTMNLVALYSHDFDFQRDMRSGDKFELLFGPGTSALSARAPTIEFASLTVRFKRTDYYRFHTGSSGAAGYYDRSGRSARKLLMRTPVNGARISSTFGKRKHPVLGFTRQHGGVDFAAPTGTAVLASGDGVVIRARPDGSYGNYIRLRHAGGYMTGYGHLSRFGKGLRKGSVVTQGQVIGYVGTTGLSSGPHLHYEVLREEERLNPLALEAMTGHRLGGAALEAFQARVVLVDKIRAQQPGGALVAGVAN